ncbi:unnamed protein product [Ectocarpus fasciculatus]
MAGKKRTSRSFVKTSPETHDGWYAYKKNGFCRVLKTIYPVTSSCIPVCIPRGEVCHRTMGHVVLRGHATFYSVEGDAYAVYPIPHPLVKRNASDRILVLRFCKI